MMMTMMIMTYLPQVDVDERLAERVGLGRGGVAVREPEGEDRAGLVVRKRRLLTMRIIMIMIDDKDNDDKDGDHHDDNLMIMMTKMVIIMRTI